MLSTQYTCVKTHKHLFIYPSHKNKLLFMSTNDNINTIITRYFNIW